MAKTHTGLVYPFARGRRFQVLNAVVEDIIETITQIYFCDAKEKWPKAKHAQHSYIWKRIHDYAGKVIKFHKY